MTCLEELALLIILICYRLFILEEGWLYFEIGYGAWSADLGKGAKEDVAVSFVEAAKERVLVRALLIMGLPAHYRFSRQEIKSKIVTFMKEHPQGVFRMNQ